jgi:hypothetical protein
MARMLYLVIDSYSSKSSPVPFPSIALLCRILCCKEETYRKYRKELESRGLLRVERHRGAGMKFERNRYYLLDGDENVEKPSPKKPTMEKIDDGKKPSRPNTTTKSTQDLKIDHSQRRHEVPKPERENAAGAAQPPSPCLSPSGTYAPPSAPQKAPPSAPQKAPPAAPRGTPAEETGKLLTEWSKWYGWFYQEAFFVDVKQKKVVQAFFADNPDMTARELMAIALRAWHQAHEFDTETHWWCIYRSQLPANLVSGLADILGETGWQREEDWILNTYREVDKYIRKRNQEKE